MNNNNIFFSIIMPAYNSENTIGLALDSIRKQTFPQDKIEILIIDGGSTDKTVEIAKEYGAVVLKNEKRLPEIAKCIGIKAAKGKWIIRQDSDEIYVNNEQLMMRYQFISENRGVYVIVANRLLTGKNMGFSSGYLNDIGDPFTYIVNRNYYGSIIKNYKENISHAEGGAYILSFHESDILPIGDGGTTTLCLDKVKELYGEAYCSEEIVCSMTNVLAQKTSYVGCIEGDDILHYSKATLKQYLKKQKFKIYNNIFNIKQSGFGTRAFKNKRLQKRKSLFAIYALTVVGPLVDSFRLAVRFRDFSFMMHFVYTYYILFFIIVGYIKKMCRAKLKELNYG